MFLAAVAAVALLLTACSSSKKTSTGTATTGTAATGGGAQPTGKTITAGLIMSQTGAAAPGFIDTQKGVLARFDLENSKGGVNGNKLALEVADDQSTPNGSLTAAQSLVSKNVLGVISVTAYLFGANRYLSQQGIPVVGGGWDGTYWGDPTFSSFFAVNGASDPHQPAPTTFGEIFKKLGATNVAVLGYGSSPSSTANVKNVAASSKAAGLKATYVNTSLPFGTVDLATTALDIKNAGSDGVWCSCIGSTNAALTVALKQAGVNMKVPLFPTGYGSDTLSSAQAVAASQNAYYTVPVQPVEMNTSATKTMADALAKQGLSGSPPFGILQGYVAADLFIKGLQVAGNPPTREGFISGLSKVTDYDLGGLYGDHKVNFVTGRGKVAQGTTVDDCDWVVQLKGNSFVPVQGSLPTCGTNIPNTNAA